MCQSAGLRTRKPVARFSDEFATLGSRSTLTHATEAVEKSRCGEYKEENKVVNNLLLESKAARIAAETVCMGEDMDAGMYMYRMLSGISHYRVIFYNVFKKEAGRRSGLSDEAVHLLSHYAPYLTVLRAFEECSPRSKDRDLLEKTADILKFKFENVASVSIWAKKRLTMVDHENLNVQLESEVLTIHLQRMMEEVERVQSKAIVRCMEDKDRNLEGMERAIYELLDKSPLIRGEFSRTVVEEFLVKALAVRAQIMLEINVEGDRPYLEEYDSEEEAEEDYWDV